MEEVFFCSNCNIPNIVNLEASERVRDYVSQIILETQKIIAERDELKKELDLQKAAVTGYYITTIKSAIQKSIQDKAQNRKTKTNDHRDKSVVIKINMPYFAYRCMFGAIEPVYYTSNKDSFESLFQMSVYLDHKHNEFYDEIVFYKCDTYNHKPKIEYNEVKNVLSITIWYCTRNGNGELTYPLLDCGKDCFPLKKPR